MTDIGPDIRALRGPILVTGASGFVGANLFTTIAAQRSDVFAGVRRTGNRRLAGVRETSVITADLNDAAAAQHLVDTVAPQTVFDCAAYGAYSFETDAELIDETNVNAMQRLVQALCERPLTAFIHAGSSSEYGTNCAAPPEDAVCEPNSDYAVAKLAATEYLRSVGRVRNFPCATLRLYSVYGPLEDTSRLIPNVLRKALAGTLPPFVDPNTSRDFVHVDDVCAAFIRCGARMRPELYGEIFNIGTGVRTTIAELAALVRTMFGVAEEPRFGTMPPRDWDLADWYADPRKAATILGWTARIPLAEGLRSTAEWVAKLDDRDFEHAGNKSAGTPR